MCPSSLLQKVVCPMMTEDCLITTFHCPGDATVCLPYTIDHDWKWTQHRLSVTHNDDPFPQAAGIVVCRVLQGKLGKHVWRTKDFLIAADMDELSETTAVPWDYSTRRVNRMQSILRKKTKPKKPFIAAEKENPKAGMPNSSSCRMRQSYVYRTKLRNNLRTTSSW